MTKGSLHMEQTHQTVQRLSHRQVVFVRVLEMSGPELEDEVRRQLDDNPALEVVDKEPAQEEYDDSQTDATAQDYMGDDLDDDPADRSSIKAATRESDFSTAQIADDTPDLYSFLIGQLGEIEMPELTRQIALYIIGNIDENGWLTRTLSEMADDITIATGIEITREQMLEAFTIVRDLDPAGVGAVDLRDCLLLQLNRIEPKTLSVKIAENIVNDYFDLFSKRHFDRLQAYLGIGSLEMNEALKLIRTLNPKPGSAIAASPSSLRINQITPDVAVDVSEDGIVTVSLINNIPQLQIEKSFSIDETINNSGAPALVSMQRQAQTFIKHKRDEAEDFINALKQRSNTLLKVTEAIVSMQPDFFISGDPSKIRPMILKDIEARTGLDISMISRATAGKYVATNTGTYPLKMFFNEATQDDNETSSHKILHELQHIVDNEDKRHPLSDEEIQGLLTEKGYTLARRTVAKYREKLGIPVKRLRKEYN